MREIARFEANLLRVLHGLFRGEPVEQYLPILLKPLPRPKCLSRDAVELVEDTLARGCVQFLARRGWMRDRFLREERIVEGRLWERTLADELGLPFSRYSLELLIQIVSGTIGSTVPKPKDVTLGDRLLSCLLLDALRSTEPGDQMKKKWLPLQQDGLCRLAFLEDFPEDNERRRIDWIIWTTGPGAAIMEALQGWLADRWTQLEIAKHKLSAVARMRSIGTTQLRVYGEYLDALAGVRRWDLARCFLITARRLLQHRPPVHRWIHNLDVRNERMADRQAIYQEALAFVRLLERFQQWQNDALSIGYFDDGYQATQLWKADWEHFEVEGLCEHARAMVREVEPMKQNQ